MTTYVNIHLLSCSLSNLFKTQHAIFQAYQGEKCFEDNPRRGRDGSNSNLSHGTRVKLLKFLWFVVKSPWIF